MKYILAEACQNTFILVDLLDQQELDESMKSKIFEGLELEDRDDALILIKGYCDGPSYYASMLVLGRDQQFAEFCGNGSRACAAYLHAKFPEFDSIFLNTKYGPRQLIQHEDKSYSIKLPPVSFELNNKFILDTDLFHREFSFTYVEMLEPHLLFKGNISDAALLSLGRDINQRKNLFPHGINLNAYHSLPNGSIFVKTYERGVQRLTQSCGTGSISCAAFLKGNGTTPVVTPGGYLNITIESDGVVLKGPATLDFDNSRIATVG